MAEPPRQVEADIAPDIPREWVWHEMRPDRGCPLCMPNLFQRVASPLGVTYCEQRLAALLRMADQHAHPGVSIGNHEADLVLLRTPVPLVVEYDGGWAHKKAATISNEAAQLSAWQNRGLQVVRLRDPGLAPTGPLDLCLPRGLNRMNDVLGTDMILEHVLRRAGLCNVEVEEKRLLMARRIGRML